MIARITRPLRAVALLPFVVVVAGFAPAAHAKPRPAPPTPAYSPPPAEESPFSHADAFCVPDDNKFETVPPTDPQLRAQPAEVVWLTTPDATGATPDQDADIERFARIVEQCGGIGGRPLDVHVVHTTGDQAADCAAAVDHFHPVIVVSSELPSSWSCIVHDDQTVLLTGSGVSNAELTGSGGRLVATGSSDGIEQARLIALVASGRLDGHKVAIVSGADAAGTAFHDAAVAALATRRLRPVALAEADVVLTPTLDLAALPQFQAATTPTASQPLEVYSFATADPLLPDALVAQPATSERVMRAMRLYAFTPVDDRSYRASQSPNTFSGMCNRAEVDEVAKRGEVTTTTTEPQPPLGPSYLTTADVCLLSRVVARGLFSAGPTLDQRAVITALHRLPYIDQAAPGGTPKPRPNQVVNEPVKRLEQTIVLTQVQSDCPSSSTTTTTTTVGPPAVLCWLPAPGWDDGGRVVNVPFPATRVAVSH
jgi:hypothetical protein